MTMIENKGIRNSEASEKERKFIKEIIKMRRKRTTQAQYASPRSPCTDSYLGFGEIISIYGSNSDLDFLE